MKTKNKALFSAFISNFLEFYDFSLFGAFSIYFSQLFFSGDKWSTLLKSLSVLGVSFIARPFGSLFFGYIGDRYGRKQSLSFSILLMGVATFGIGCLPTYNEIGVVSAVLLVICRLLQGFSLGGESTGSYVFLLEQVKVRKAFIGALVLASGTTGMLFANFQAQLFTQCHMPEWSWRIPFWLGFIIAILGVYIRSSVNESAEFSHLSNKLSSVSEQFKLLSNYKRSLFRVIGIALINSTYVYIIFIYMNVYHSHFSMPFQSLTWLYSNLGLFFTLIFVPISGYIADKIHHEKLLYIASLLSFIGAFLIPYCLYKNYLFFATFSLALLVGMLNAPTPAFINNLFPTSIRYTGVSVGFSLGVALFGGFSPFFFTFLTKYFGNTLVLTPMLIIVSFIGLISLMGKRKQQT